MDKYPIGTKVEMMYNTYPEVPKGTIGTVINNRNWLIIDWGFPVDVNDNCGWNPSETEYPGRFRIVGCEKTVKTVQTNADFCSCGSKNVIENTANGKSFLYCRGCKKERQYTKF